MFEKDVFELTASQNVLSAILEFRKMNSNGSLQSRYELSNLERLTERELTENKTHPDIHTISHFLIFTD